ncbi:MAG: urease accessory protein UreE [Microvirga sp.]
MLRATAVVRKAAVKPDRVADTVVLDQEGRHRRRVALKGEGGLDFLLDLDKAAALADGDAVRLEDGRLVQVKAAPQALIEIRAENPLRLMRVAWHIGNRHTPAEIGADAIWIEDDHVLAEMVRGQGCTATPVRRPFRPERGAYEHDCGHDHGHAHHAHHAHHHGRKPDDAPHHHDDHAHHHDNAGHSDHEHGPGCGHHNHGEHGHKHDHR